MKSLGNHTMAASVAGVILAWSSLPAAAQVWVDATQLGDRKPDWVDARYYQPAAQEPARRTEWVTPSPCRRIWHEAVYQTLCDRIWVDGHHETRRVIHHDPCGCPVVHEECVWIPGHYETIQRRVCVTPGYWETIQVSELGHRE